MSLLKFNADIKKIEIFAEKSNQKKEDAKIHLESIIEITGKINQSKIKDDIKKLLSNRLSKANRKIEKMFS